MADVVTWTAANGQVIEFTDWAAGHFFTGDGTTGLWAPSYEVTAERYAGIDGTTVQAIRAAESQPTLGLFIRADSKQAFRQKARALVHALRPKAGIGRLTVTTDWGDSRSLACYCVGGLEGDMAPGVLGPGPHWRMVLKFYAPSPWWEGAEQEVAFTLGDALNVFFPIPPVRPAGSLVAGQFTVDLSDTDSPTYPRWTVTGPGSTLVLENVTTGRAIQVNATLAADEVLVIDTRPGFQSVQLTDGTNLMGSLASDPALWPLVEGVNTVSVSLASATAASRIQGTFRPRYSGI